MHAYRITRVYSYVSTYTYTRTNIIYSYTTSMYINSVSVSLPTRDFYVSLSLSRHLHTHLHFPHLTSRNASPRVAHVPLCSRGILLLVYHLRVHAGEDEDLLVPSITSTSTVQIKQPDSNVPSRRRGESLRFSFSCSGVPSLVGVHRVYDVPPTWSGRKQQRYA